MWLTELYIFPYVTLSAELVMCLKNVLYFSSNNVCVFFIRYLECIQWHGAVSPAERSIRIKSCRITNQCENLLAGGVEAIAVYGGTLKLNFGL